ncbi:MAG: dTDP-4-dehydrorhamnose reductase [Bacteroidales bacterium]|nr:dTDP-4-dehydrorhamnose reductase [Bacteroidales bacterium]
MNSVIILGANGQLGSEIKKIEQEFVDLNIVYTDIEELDISNLSKLKLFFNNRRFSYIVNAAAYTAVDKAETEEKKATQVNVEGVTNLARLATNYKSHLIHISTDYVFDGKANKPYVEDSPTNPLNIYGKTKLKSEIEALRHVETIVIRTSWLYSTFGNNFVKTIIKNAREKNELKVVYDQVGSPTYAEDLARAILTIIHQQVHHKNIFKRGIYHFANHGVCSWYDFAKEIVNYFNFSCQIQPILTDEYPTPAKRPSYSVLHCQKFKETFNQEIPYWRESLHRCLSTIKI